jgi:hypothetical protein
MRAAISALNNDKLKLSEIVEEQSNEAIISTTTTTTKTTKKFDAKEIKSQSKIKFLKRISNIKLN